MMNSTTILRVWLLKLGRIFLTTIRFLVPLKMLLRHSLWLAVNSPKFSTRPAGGLLPVTSPAEFQRSFGPPPGDGDGGDRVRHQVKARVAPHEEAPPGAGKARSANMGGASAGMAIHKAEGLVPVDDRCGTDTPGLYAAGDALGMRPAT